MAEADHDDIPGPHIPTTRPRQTIVSGTAAALGGQFTVYGLGFVASVLMTRAVGPSGRGAYYVATTATIMALALVHLSIEWSNTYFYAQRTFSLGQLASAAAAMALILGPLGVGILELFYLSTHDTIFRATGQLNFLIAALTLPFQLHTMWMANLFLLDKRLLRSQIGMVLGALAQTGGAVALFAIGSLDVRTILLLYAASALIPWAAMALWSRSFAPTRPRFTREITRAVTSYGARLHLGFVSYYMLLRSDVFLVGALLGTRYVGVYSVAVLFAELLWFVTNPLAQAIMPFQSERSVEDAAALTFRAARFNLLLGVLVSALFAATLWAVIPLIYGSGFSGSFFPLVLLLPGVTAMASARPLYNWLVRQGRPLTLSFICVAAFALNLILNVILLPLIGIAGAAIASSVAYLGLSVALQVWARRVAGGGVSEGLLLQAEDLRFLLRLIGRLHPGNVRGAVRSRVSAKRPCR
jgi:O-antigen/teichoic acid export membrane protein